MALGYYYWQGVGDYDKALEHFSLVKGRQPNDVDALRAIGGIRRRQGKWNQAAVQLEQAVKLDPRNGNLLVILGSIYFYMRPILKGRALHGPRHFTGS